MEVEMLMMYVIFGGVSVCLFIMYYNVFDMLMYLCIVFELYLKCLVVGGFDCVFEINCNFCNEGFFLCYNLEFIMMEFYMVYVDYKDLMDLMEELFSFVVLEVFGLIFMFYGEYIVEFGGKYVCMSMFDVIKYYNLNYV